MLPAGRSSIDSDALRPLTSGSSYIPYDICTTLRSSLPTGVKRQSEGAEVSQDMPPILKSSIARNNVPNLLHNRQIGLNWKTKFTTDYANTKSKEMTVSNLFSTVGQEECEFVKHSCNNKSLIAVWKTGSPDTSHIYYFYFHFNRKYEDYRSKPSLVHRMCRSNRIFANGIVVDICEIPHSDRNCLLYVSNTHNRKLQWECDTSLIDFNIPIHKSCTELSDKYIYCCASNGDGQVFATGSEDGCSIFENRSFSHKIKMLGHVTSVALNKSGNTLFYGTDTFGLSMLDLREPHIEDFMVNSVYYKPGGILEMKLLSDEKSIILCDENGSLSKVEWNKPEPVVKYEGHSCFSNRSPLSINEENDLLCATGSDKLTRVWSLNTGELLHTIRPQHPYENVHSSLITLGSRWFVTLLQKDKIFVVEPCISS